MGQKVRYDGQIKGLNSRIISQLEQKARLFPFCPEVAGGLPVPRPPAEIIAHDGFDVLDGKACIINKNNIDVTDFFIKGANLALEFTKKNNITHAILKEKSPSCGTKMIYDGTFTNKIKMGCGVTAALLSSNNIEIISDEDLGAFFIV